MTKAKSTHREAERFQQRFYTNFAEHVHLPYCAPHGLSGFASVEHALSQFFGREGRASAYESADRMALHLDFLDAISGGSDRSQFRMARCSIFRSRRSNIGNGRPGFDFNTATGRRPKSQVMRRLTVANLTNSSRSRDGSPDLLDFRAGKLSCAMPRGVQKPGHKRVSMSSRGLTLQHELRRGLRELLLTLTRQELERR